MRSRESFGRLYQQHKQLGVGAEIGVHQGEFVKLLSENWDGRIICVDIWENEGIYKNMISDTLRNEKYKVIRGASLDVVKTIEDGSLDWVYIDADHSYEGVKDDHTAWAPKVRSGGIVSGHDYGENTPDVKRFIDELKSDIPFQINFTIDDKNNSWWYIK